MDKFSNHSLYCDPKDISVKSFFLGPQAENGAWLRQSWLKIIDQWLMWRENQFPGDGRSISEKDQRSEPFRITLNRMDEAIERVLQELENETNKFSPRYLGHMVSEVSMPGLLGHICALLHNPNNTSKEVSKITSVLEEEAIAGLATMVGFSSQARGHFTSGGTLANFEALWRARFRLDLNLSRHLSSLDRISAKSNSLDLDQYSLLKLGPWQFASKYERITGHAFKGPIVLVPQNKHFSWLKAVSLMGLGEDTFVGVSLDSECRLDVNDLKRKISWAQSEHRPILLIVSVAGTTELGEVDLIHEVQAVIDEARLQGEDLWHHVDAAYGGYYCCMLDGGELEAQLEQQVAQALKAIAQVDSITLDPHKLGYVPYSCGAFIARDSDHYEGRFFAAAYLHQKNKSMWSNTIEGSRSGTGVTATWLSNQALGLDSNGYGRVLSKGIQARKNIVVMLKQQMPDIFVLEPTDLNIVTFCLVQNGEKLSTTNNRNSRVFERFEQSPTFSISKTVLLKNSYAGAFQQLSASRRIDVDVEELYLLRMVLMNPFIESKESRTDYFQEFINELKLLSNEIEF